MVRETSAVGLGTPKGRRTAAVNAEAGARAGAGRTTGGKEGRNPRDPTGGEPRDPATPRKALVSNGPLTTRRGRSVQAPDDHSKDGTPPPHRSQREWRPSTVAVVEVAVAGDGAATGGRRQRRPPRRRVQLRILIHWGRNRGRGVGGDRKRIKTTTDPEGWMADGGALACKRTVV